MRNAMQQKRVIHYISCCSFFASLHSDMIPVFYCHYSLNNSKKARETEKVQSDCEGKISALQLLGIRFHLCAVIIDGIRCVVPMSWQLSFSFIELAWLGAASVLGLRAQPNTRTNMCLLSVLGYSIDDKELFVNK